MDREKINDIIINNLPHGFSLVDANGVIMEFNRAAEQITGYSKGEIIGRSHLDIFHGSSDKAKCPLMQFAFHSRKGIDSLESTLKRKNGETITISVTVFPIHDDKGSFMGGVELFRDITAQKKSEREHKNMLSMFAHDMKNPVVIALGALSRLLSNKTGDVSEKQREYGEIMEEELQRLQELISDFLQFSRFEAKEYVPVCAPFSICDELTAHLEYVRGESDKKAIRISLAPCDDLPKITADRSMINRVISNLIDNAIKYTNPGGTIEVAVSVEDEQLSISIKDTGVGISGEHLPFIFDAFYRVSKDSKGSGLGLFIAKTIVEAHGGSIRAESVPARGSTFTFSLPLAGPKQVPHSFGKEV
ncbi:MAG TPA: PAS domain-containing sensor histidine kinase [Dissulfurispiraceae bacterium]|nr:PAS domain-containing sensor histidine kinase [Dissulfurispiraceae bacterium]